MKLISFFLFCFTLSLNGEILQPPDLSIYNVGKTISDNERIELFSVLYRAENKNWSEALAVKTLLDRNGSGIRSKRVWNHLLPLLKEMGCPDQFNKNYDKCEKPLLQKVNILVNKEIEALMKNSTIEKYFSYLEDGAEYPDFLLYATPHYKSAARYGLFVFRLELPKISGIDLNEYNRVLFNYYDVSIFEKLNPRRIKESLGDKDEIAFAGYLLNKNLVGVDINNEGYIKSKANISLIPGDTVRRYQVKDNHLELFVKRKLSNDFRLAGKIFVENGEKTVCSGDFNLKEDWADENFRSLPNKVFIDGRSIIFCRENN